MRGWNETKEEQQEILLGRKTARNCQPARRRRMRINAGDLMLELNSFLDDWSRLFFPLSVNINRNRGELLNRRNAEVFEINEHPVLKRSISLSVEYSGSGKFFGVEFLPKI